MLLWLLDPFTTIAMFIAYVVGYIALFAIALTIAPRVAGKLSDKLSLYGSMYLAMLLVLVGGFAAIYLISYALVQLIGFSIELLAGLVLMLIMANIFTYFISPLMINAFYGARPDEELQEIVNEVAKRAGMKPPKAVIVEGPPNAFAYGNFLTGRYVAVTQSLLNMLSRSELEAVIGHELGHHKHRDSAIMLLMGLIPSTLYYLGIVLIRAGILGGYARDERRGGGSPGVFAMMVGILSIVLSFIMQVLVLAFSRLREYYADAHGALVAGVKSMQRSLAKIHLYYSASARAQAVKTSKLRTLFIYALTEAVANPFYSYYGGHYRSPYMRDEGIDEVIEDLKRERVDPVSELFSSHPPIPKRLKFLDSVSVKPIKA